MDVIQESFSLYEVNDRLTGLLSMGQFFQFCTDILGKCKTEGEVGQYHFAYFNIRNFKSFNVEYGMAKGDEVLTTFSQILPHNLDTKIIARFTADQFVIMSKEDNLKDKILQIVADFNLLYYGRGLKLKVGIYQVSGEEIIVTKACDYAKAACDFISDSKEEIYIFDEALKKKIDTRNYVISHLEEAIEKSYIKVYYQPVVRTINHSLVGMEALARWIDPVVGFLSPGDFIPVLEENRLITKLDLFVFQEICRHMKEAEEAGMTLIPVSFNLSRLDFFECDIFEEIEKTVKEYRIPRDLINVEITESTIIDDPEQIKKVIGKFRQVGYQVWMDDFGSGYSSLNVLQEYEFDEIKLDMVFMRRFDEKSKQIVRSIVEMAKKLGIKTLAEGVEDEEQYNFLREIGCERIQGYYISKPLPRQMLVDEINNKGIQVEARAWRRYYDCVGEVNFMTDRSLAIMEFDGEKYKTLFVNEPYMEVLRRTGRETLDMLYITMNSKTSPLSRQLRDLQKMLEPGGEEKTIEYTINGYYIRLKGRCLCQHENCMIDEFEITNLSVNEAEDERENLDFVNRMMFSTYDALYTVELGTREFKSILQGAHADQDVASICEGQEFHPDMIVERFIHRDDQELFHQFIDPDTVLDRIRKSSRGYLTEFFRTKSNNGSYVWKAHTMLYVPEQNMIIYATRYTPLTKRGLIERVLDTKEQKMQGRSLSLQWNTLMDSQAINLFWKDKDRRFLGANERFLKTYGFKNVFDILGKTDEDMHWHVDDGPFRDDEWRVLNEGVTIQNQIGKCNIRGVNHNILVTKEPIYEDGKIVGLVGTFINIDELVESTGEMQIINITDRLTGLMSMQGIVNSITDYIDAWQTNGEKFAFARISYPDYQRAVHTYGGATAKQMIGEVGHIIGEEISQMTDRTITAGRLFGSEFVVLLRYQERSEVEELDRYLQKRSSEIHELCGYAATLSPETKVYYAEDMADVEDIVFWATSGVGTSGGSVNE